jgi:hypothetical protein
VGRRQAQRSDPRDRANDRHHQDDRHHRRLHRHLGQLRHDRRQQERWLQLHRHAARARQHHARSQETRYVVFNNTTGGFALTVKTATGAGVTIPNGRCAAVYCDSVDVKSAVPTTGGTTTPTSGSADIAAWSAVEAAIAAASGLTAPFILISGTDTTPGYAGTKITAGGLLKQNVSNPTGNAVIEFDATGYVASGSAAYVIAAAAAAKTAFKTTYLITFTNANTGAATLDDGSGAVALTDPSGAALKPFDIPAGATRLVVYDGTQFQVPIEPPPFTPAMAAAMTAAMI